MKTAKQTSVSVNYCQEERIQDFPIGQVFAAGADLWVKIDNNTCIIIGKGKVVEYTPNCKAFPVRHIEASL